MDVVDDDELRILIADAVDAVFEALRIGRCPPVAEVALGVELPPFIIEGMVSSWPMVAPVLP